MTEETLLQQLKERNESAFRWLVEKYQDKVYNTVLSILQNESEAEDVAQEVFIKVFESIQSFRAESSLATWIYRISVHKSLDRLRKKKSREKLTVIFPWIMEREETFYHPGVMLDRKEKAALLFHAIRQLPEKQQVAFTLVKVQGMSYEEVSEIMDQSVKSIESLISRAKINLQKYLERIKI